MTSAIVMGYVTLITNGKTELSKVPKSYQKEVEIELERIKNGAI